MIESLQQGSLTGPLLLRVEVIVNIMVCFELPQHCSGEWSILLSTIQQQCLFSVPFHCTWCLSAVLASQLFRLAWGGTSPPFHSAVLTWPDINWVNAIDFGHLPFSGGGRWWKEEETAAPLCSREEEKENVCESDTDRQMVLLHRSLP